MKMIGLIAIIVNVNYSKQTIKNINVIIVNIYKKWNIFMSGLF